MKGVDYMVNDTKTGARTQDVSLVPSSRKSASTSVVEYLYTALVEGCSENQLTWNEIM